MKIIKLFLIVLFIIILGGCINISSNNLNNDIPLTENNQIHENVIDFSNLKYTAIGDSITYGASPSGKQWDKPYCDAVGDILELNEVVNLGVGGSTIVGTDTKAMNIRISEIPNDTDIISILGGCNDWSRGKILGNQSSTSTTTFYGTYKYILKTLKLSYPNAFIFVMTPLHRKDAENNALSSTGITLSQVAGAVKYVANMYDVPVLDLYNLGGYENYYDEDGSDGVHPNQEYHKNILAPLIAQFIKENYTR